MIAGDRLGPYEILSLIGEGGMGEVYKCRDTRLDRMVALKVSKAEFSERFEREARAVAALNHPNICALHDVGPNYLVMEFIDGPTLAERIAGGPMSSDAALPIARQMAEAIEAAHEKGVIHRDLKPENVKLTGEGVVKILDFGLAKAAEIAQDPGSAPTIRASASIAGMIIGTPAYMSPEQASGKQVDKRTDIWAYAVILWEMVTGRRMFEGETISHIMAAVLTQQPDLNAAPPQLRPLLERCLIKDPKKRMRDIGEARIMLDAGLPAPRPGSQARPAATRRTYAIALVALLFGALAMWAINWLGQRPPEDRVHRFQINAPADAPFAAPTSPIAGGGFAISPDGNLLAFVSVAGQTTRLWVRRLDGSEARPIAGTDGAIYPFWSPDSSSIAFTAANKLMRVNVAGGAPQVICSDAAAGGAWDWEGYIVFGSFRSGLKRVLASGGAPSPLTTLSAGELSHRWPQLIPGARVLYWGQSLTNPDGSGIYVTPQAKTQERVKLLTSNSSGLYASGPRGEAYLLWLRNETLVAQEFHPGSSQLVGEPHPLAETVRSNYPLGFTNVTVSSGGLLLYGNFVDLVRQLTLVNRAGQSLKAIGGEAEYTGPFRLSHDERQVAAAQPRGGISILEIERNIASPFTFPPAGSDHYPIWSPDGRTLVFSRVGTQSLFRKETNGVAAEQVLIKQLPTPNPLDWSGNGQHMLIHDFSAGALTADLWTLSMTADGHLQKDAKPVPYSQTRFSERFGRFSPEPNPRWIAFVSDETGRDEVYIDAFPTPRGKKRISTAGGRYPQWGGSVNEVFFISPDEKLMAASLKVTADSVEPSVPHELFQLPSPVPGPSRYEALKDGQRFLILIKDKQRNVPPIEVIVNWPALIKRRSSQ